MTIRLHSPVILGKRLAVVVVASRDCTWDLSHEGNLFFKRPNSEIYLKCAFHLLKSQMFWQNLCSLQLKKMEWGVSVCVCLRIVISININVLSWVEEKCV